MFISENYGQSLQTADIVCFYVPVLGDLESNNYRISW